MREKAGKMEEEREMQLALTVRTYHREGSESRANSGLSDRGHHLCSLRMQPGRCRWSKHVAQQCWWEAGMWMGCRQGRGEDWALCSPHLVLLHSVGILKSQPREKRQLRLAQNLAMVLGGPLALQASILAISYSSFAFLKTCHVSSCLAANWWISAQMIVALETVSTGSVMLLKQLPKG